jgi:hypothetical protein
MVNGTVVLETLGLEGRWGKSASEEQVEIGSNCKG